MFTSLTHIKKIDEYTDIKEIWQNTTCRLEMIGIDMLIVELLCIPEIIY